MRRFPVAEGGLASLTHMVEPSLTYQYLPWVNQSPFPQFDSVDFVSPQNRLTFQLGNRLMARPRGAKGEGEVFEYASLSLAQSFNLQPRSREFSDVYLAGLTPERVDQAVKDVRPLGNGFSQVRERAWSNTVLSGQVSPHPTVGLRGAVAVNPEEARMDGASGSLELRWPDLLSLGIDQTFVRGQQASGFVARAELAATKTIRLDYLTRYEAVSGTFMEHGVGLRYSSCCWEFSIRYTHRSELDTRAAENDIKFSVDIKIPTPAGVGSGDERTPAGRWLSPEPPRGAVGR
jgi:hypothetical protein